MPASMSSRIFMVVAALVPAAVFCQPPAVLNNTGEPMRVSYACAEEGLQAAGLLCTEDEPCAIYLELNSIGTAGKKLFLAGDLHATSGTLASIMLATDDGGATWKEPTPRIRSAALEQVQFHDLEHGWAAGETQYPLPRDPFFLVSTDGGQSWRHRAVNEEGGPGSIQRFWFDSPQHGELLVDAGKTAVSGRYLLYESETGGESWMIRSTTGEMPKLKSAPAVLDNSDFRITPSNDAIRIERRLGEKWEPLASFLIEVASCKLKAPQLKEPPPEADVSEKELEPPKDYVDELQIGGPANKPPAKKPAPK